MVDFERMRDEGYIVVPARHVAAAMLFCKGATPHTALDGVAFTTGRGCPEVRATDSYMAVAIQGGTPKVGYESMRDLDVLVPTGVLKQLVKASPKATLWVAVRDEGDGMRSCALLDSAPNSTNGATVTWQDSGKTFPARFLDVLKVTGEPAKTLMSSKLLATACKAAQVATGDKDVTLHCEMRGTVAASVWCHSERTMFDALLMPRRY